MKKGPFKMKKSPTKHTGMDMPAIGMLGGGNNNSVVGGNIGGSNPMVGMLGAQTGQALITKETRKRKGGRNKRGGGMGAYNMFKNRIKGIFG